MGVESLSLGDGRTLSRRAVPPLILGAVFLAVDRARALAETDNHYQIEYLDPANPCRIDIPASLSPNGDHTDFTADGTAKRVISFINQKQNIVLNLCSQDYDPSITPRQYAENYVNSEIGTRQASDPEYGYSESFVGKNHTAFPTEKVSLLLTPPPGETIKHYRAAVFFQGGEKEYCIDYDFPFIDPTNPFTTLKPFYNSLYGFRFGTK